MFVRVNDKFIEMAEIQNIEIRSRRAGVEDVYIGFTGDDNAIALAGDDAMKMIFFLDYVLPSAGGLADVNHTYKYKDTVIKTQQMTEKARGEKLAQLAELAAAELSGKARMDNEGNISLPPGFMMNGPSGKQ
jgi:hypothetical protein